MPIWLRPNNDGVLAHDRAQFFRWEVLEEAPLTSEMFAYEIITKEGYGTCDDCGKLYIAASDDHCDEEGRCWNCCSQGDYCADPPDGNYL